MGHLPPGRVRVSAARARAGAPKGKIKEPKRSRGDDVTSAPKVVGSNPAPATTNDEGLADVEAASPFRLPRLPPGIRFVGLGAPARPAPGETLPNLRTR